MRSKLAAAVLATALLASCKPGAAVDPRATASKAPGPQASARASAAPSVAPGAASFLKPPSASAERLEGQVFVEAGYATAFGGAAALVGADGASLVGMDGATLIGNAGGTLIGNAGGTLIGNAGGTLIGNAGGTLVAAGAGNVVVPSRLVGPDGATLIGPDGASLIGPDGASLVGPDGASIVSRDGASMVAAGAGNYALGAAPYHLAQAGAAFGQLAPAAGMWLSVVDDTTGLTVPLGVDEAGKPVHTVYTNALGKYEVYVPKEVAAHARVVARAPGRRDARLVLGVFAQGDGVRRVDDDEAAVAQYFRYVVARRLIGAMALPGWDEGATAAAADPALAGTALLLGSLRTALVEAGWERLDPARREALGLVAAGWIYHRLRLDEEVLDPEGVDLFDPAAASAYAGKPVIAELAGVVKDVRRAAALAVPAGQTAQAFYGAKPYVLAANLRREPDDRYVIARSGDMMDFVLQEYLSHVNQNRLRYAYDVLADIGLPAAVRDKLALASDAVGRAFLGGLADPARGFDLNALVAVVRARAGELAKAPAAPARPRTGPPAPSMPAAPDFGAWDVETLEGTFGAAPGVRGLALDERGPTPVMYVAASAEHTVRKYFIDGTGKGAVGIHVGTPGEPGALDAFGEHARLRDPVAVALDAAGALFVLEGEGGRLLKVVDTTSGPEVTTVAGGGPEGLQDGPGRTVSFKAPQSMAFDRDGSLVVADSGHQRLRRVTFGPDGATVSTLGGADGSRAEGALGASRMHLPLGLAFGPDGTLFFADLTGGSDTIRAVAGPVGPASRTRLVAGGVRELARRDGFWDESWFHLPAAIAVDPQGRLVVADRAANLVRMATPDGWVGTIAGTGEPGLENGSGAQARFNQPAGLAIGKDGTIYVGDYLNGTIRRLRPR